MARLAVVIASLSLGLILCPMPWMFLGLGAGIFAMFAGWLTFRERALSGAARLFGAGAASVGLLAVTLGSVRLGLSIAAAARLAELVS
ncbi:MAG: hypothetical protein IPI49_05395 [Myxococcales bacterium]|jgi:hypothetical protein|nr:hypothetical protein [Myxococcales bacterium]HRC58028.1 hypothetical protein [Kofleriaceae bacterium]